MKTICALALLAALSVITDCVEKAHNKLRFDLNHRVRVILNPAKCKDLPNGDLLCKEVRLHSDTATVEKEKEKK